MKWPQPSRVTTFILVATGLFVAMVIIAVAALILNSRNEDLSSSEEQAIRFTNGASMALNRNLLGVDILLASINEVLGLSMSMVDWIDLPTASQALTRAAQQNMLMRNLSLLDQQGNILATSNPAGKSGPLHLPTGFLEEALAQPVSTLVISAPAVSDLSAESVLYLARHVHLADTSLVLAIAEVPINLLTGIMVQGVDIPGLEVTFERTNGQLLASSPLQNQLDADRLTLPLEASAPNAKPIRSAARLSGQPAIVVTRPLLYRGLVVAASLPIEAALEGWRVQRNLIVGATLTFVLMILVACAVAINYLV